MGSYTLEVATGFVGTLDPISAASSETANAISGGNGNADGQDAQAVISAAQEPLAIQGHWDAATDLIRPQGHIVTIVENEKPLKQDAMKLKAATLSWELMFTRSMYRTPDMIEQHYLLNRIAGWIDEGRIRATATNVMPPINAANLREAHAQLESGRAIGKIVLKDWEQSWKDRCAYATSTFRFTWRVRPSSISWQ